MLGKCRVRKETLCCRMQCKLLDKTQKNSAVLLIHYQLDVFITMDDNSNDFFVLNDGNKNAVSQNFASKRKQKNRNYFGRIK